MDSVKKQRIGEIIINILILLATPVVFVLPAYYFERSLQAVLRTGIIAFFMGLLLVYALEEMRIQEDFLPGNRQRQRSFLFFYLLMLLLAQGARFVSPFVLPVTVAVLMCMLLSGFLAGVCCLVTVTVSLMLTTALNGYGGIYFMVTGFVALLLFKSGKKPLYFVRKSIMLAFVSPAVYSALILLGKQAVEPSDIVNPLVGTVINFILMVILIKIYSRFVLGAYEDIYEKYNDPEHELLQQLKHKNNDEYNIAIHSAYLCDKIALKMKMDNALAKSLGYYHRIGAVSGKNVKAESIAIAEKYKFPPELIKAMQEYQKVKDTPPLMKETILCVLAVDIVNSIRYILKNDSKTKNVDYEKIIDFVFQKRAETGLFSASSLLVADVDTIKECFKEDKLYYDFLR